MLDIAHLKRVYRDFDGMMELTKESAPLLEHYYPDFKELVKEIAGDVDWIMEICAMIGLNEDHDSFEDVETAVEWGMTWATYALGPAFVRTLLKDHNKAWLAAMAVAGADPGMFMQGRKRSSLGQWLGELVGVYALFRRSVMEEQLECFVEETVIDIIVEGFIVNYISDRRLGQTVYRNAIGLTGELLNQPQIASLTAAISIQH